MPKEPTSLRLTPEAKELLRRIAQETGLTQAGVVELALRDLAKARGIKRRS